MPESGPAWSCNEIDRSGVVHKIMSRNVPTTLIELISPHTDEYLLEDEDEIVDDMEISAAERSGKTLCLHLFLLLKLLKKTYYLNISSDCILTHITRSLHRATIQIVWNLDFFNLFDMQVIFVGGCAD